MFQLKKHWFGALSLLAGAISVIMGLLALANVIEGVWPAGLALLVFACTTLLYKQASTSQRDPGGKASLSKEH